MQFFSQVGQDRFLFDHFFYGKRNGVFVDIGAYDGEKFSNTLFFERFMGWRGLCIEPLPSAFEKLVTRRKAICRQVCVADFAGESEFIEAAAGIDESMLSGLPRYFDPRHVDRLKRVATATAKHTVEVRQLSSLLLEHDLLAVDYCSIDTEGSELSILSDLDFSKFAISVLTVENNYDDHRIPDLMQLKGYEFVGKLEQDYIFRRKDVKPLPHTTVICAVWHGDPRRLELLRGHVENLSRQTVPVDSIYIFDGGDDVPDWLAAKGVSVQQPLTIYQAWNVALSLVSTPLVMNLNLDDRLGADAVETMEKALNSDRVDAVAGDWKICYSQVDTDKVELCYPADNLAFVGDWPPQTGTVTRLGSGTGQRGTLGPAVLWRITAHAGVPRYPWRFLDGTPIRSVGDLAWWTILTNMNKKIVRLPMVIGNYHSHPSEQAEFREPPLDEHEMLQTIGCAGF
jgi:FkbM family methyltransferase